MKWDTPSPGLILTFVKQADTRYILLSPQRLDGMASIKEHYPGMGVGVGMSSIPRTHRKTWEVETAELSKLTGQLAKSTL